MIAELSKSRQAADDIAALLGSLQIKQADVLGYSMGNDFLNGQPQKK